MRKVEFLSRVGLGFLTATTIACAGKQPESPTQTPIRPANEFGFDAYTPDSFITVSIPDRNMPENGTITITVHPQALIYRENLRIGIPVEELDLRAQITLDRANPSGPLTLPTAPEFANVQTGFLVGKYNEPASRDLQRGTFQRWRLRDSHTVITRWLGYCIKSVIIDGIEGVRNPRSNCLAPSVSKS